MKIYSLFFTLRLLNNLLVTCWLILQPSVITKYWWLHGDTRMVAGSRDTKLEHLLCFLKCLLLSFYIYFMCYMCFAYMDVCASLCVPAAQEGQRGCQISWQWSSRQLWAARWVLRFKPGSSWGVVKSQCSDHRANPPTSKLEHLMSNNLPRTFT